MTVDARSEESKKAELEDDEGIVVSDDSPSNTVASSLVSGDSDRESKVNR